MVQSLLDSIHNSRYLEIYAAVVFEAKQFYNIVPYLHLHFLPAHLYILQKNLEDILIIRIEVTGYQFLSI